MICHENLCVYDQVVLGSENSCLSDSDCQKYNDGVTRACKNHFCVKIRRDDLLPPGGNSVLIENHQDL